MNSNTSQRSGFSLLSQYRSVIMGFAALSIVYFHEWQYLFPGHDRALRLEDVFHRGFYFGPDLFFLMSGIGLTFAMRKGGTVWQFWGKRLKRIAIPTLLAALCMALTWHWSFADYVKNVTGYNFYVHNMYSFLWFIPAVLSVYLVFPLYWRFYSRAKNQLLFTLAALCIWAVFSYTGALWVRPDLFGFINRIPIFLIGVQFGWMTQQEKLPPEQQKRTLSVRWDKPGVWVLLGAMFVVGCILVYGFNQRGWTLILPDSNCRIPTLLLGISLAFLLAKLCEFLDRSKAGHGIVKFFEFYGAMSLEFYAIQEWLGGVLLPHLQPHMANWLINLVLFAVITAAGYLLWAVNHYFWVGTETLRKKQA